MWGVGRACGRNLNVFPFLILGFAKYHIKVLAHFSNFAGCNPRSAPNLANQILIFAAHAAHICIYLLMMIE